jgi:glycosyltransferase involved in cell wall biosynthesis
VSAFILLRKRGNIPDLKLHVGGGMGPSDEPLVEKLKESLQREGLSNEVQWFPNLTREEKLTFYKGLSLFSVPAMYGEAFGLYLVEAWAAGVPTVQPPVAAFPELTAISQGGVVAGSSDVHDLALTIEELLRNEEKRQQLSTNARKAVETRFNAVHMTRQMLSAFDEVLLVNA